METRSYSAGTRLLAGPRDKVLARPGWRWRRNHDAALILGTARSLGGPAWYQVGIAAGLARAHYEGCTVAALEIHFFARLLASKPQTLPRGREVEGLEDAQSLGMGKQSQIDGGFFLSQDEAAGTPQQSRLTTQGSRAEGGQGWSEP